MSEVPWTPGRRALVRPNGQWLEAVGVADGYIAPNGDKWRAGWVVVSRAGTSTATTWYPPDAGPTAPLPDECPRCGWLGCHEDGCMVAANLARGVPAFFASWVMETAPEGRWFERDGQYHDIILHVAGTDGALSPIGWDGHHGVLSEEPHAPRPGSGPLPYSWGFVALGPLGPTLSPWESP